MLPQVTRKLRLALVLATAVVYIGTHIDVAAAKGKKHKDTEESDDSDDEEDDEGDKGDEESEEGQEEAKDQPPVTAGGLFTLKTYPTRETLRPLTMTQGIAQVRASLGTDISNKGAFGSIGFGLEGLYGWRDNFTFRAGFNAAYLGSGTTFVDGMPGSCSPTLDNLCLGSSADAPLKQYNLWFGFEGSLLYDLFDVRVQMRLNRRAHSIYENFCSPPNPGDQDMPTDPSQCVNQMAQVLQNPNGSYLAGPTEFAIDIGFPFRYAFKPEIAIVALDTFIAVNLYSGYNFTRKPDFLPSVGIAINPIPALSVVLYAQLLVLNFDFTQQFLIPATLRVQVSPTPKLDVGLEFTLLNLKPPVGSPIDQRFINLFAQFRFGR